MGYTPRGRGRGGAGAGAGAEAGAGAGAGAGQRRGGKGQKGQAGAGQGEEAGRSGIVLIFPCCSKKALTIRNFGTVGTDTLSCIESLFVGALRT